MFSSEVFVTGSNGYIGRQLVPFLRLKGIKVNTVSIFNGKSLLPVKDIFKDKNYSTLVHLSENSYSQHNGLESNPYYDLASKNAKDLSDIFNHIIYISSVLVYEKNPLLKHTELSEKFSKTCYAKFKLNNEKTFSKKKHASLEYQIYMGMN